ncbi:MAG: KAP family NTPase [Phycisphaerales bacterium]|nr:hypothetical protein [Planctomycetota bacterium]MCH8508481.1 KAP family NTPase [Phycisphaerales bacterium]
MSSTATTYSELVRDRLDHDHAASILVHAIEHSTPPATLALFGSWGRGKTDVLRRVEEKLITGDLAAVVWANPWQSGHGDALSCIAASIAKNHIVKWSPKELAHLMTRVGRAGAALTTRVIAYPFIESFGIDADATVSATIDAAEDKHLRPLLQSTPTELATNAIGEIAERAFDGKRLVVLVDDLDRCPPSWQRALVESLHFLKTVNYPLVFIVAIDKDSACSGASSITSSYGDLGSLTCKVFDCAFELHDTSHPLHDWLINSMSQKSQLLGKSVLDCFSMIAGIEPEHVRIDRIASGACASRLLRTPRSIERTSSRLISMMATGLVTKEMIDCTNDKEMFSLGFMISIRDRYPDLVTYISTRLPNLMQNLENIPRGTNRSLSDPLFHSLDNLPVQAHGRCLLDAMGVMNIKRNSHSDHDILEIREYGSSMERAAKICDRALL